MKKMSNLKWAIVFAAVTAICIIWIIIANSKPAMFAEILVDGEIYAVIDDISSGEVREMTVETEWGENVIAYGNNEIYVKSSDCKNQTCVNFGKISSSGQSIICAPHKLVVRLKGGDDPADAVT